MVVFILGTRPEQLKFAPVWKEMRSRGLPVHVHCTGQSPDLLDETTLPWDSIGPEPPHKDFKAAMVWGDTRTALNGALWAFENGIPLMHGEAGVRTYDLSAPWPEEGYRQMISRIATWHACTTRHNRANLVAESHRPGWHPGDHYDHEAEQRRLRVTGSPIVESVRERATETDTLPRLVLTLHRRENRGHFADILAGVEDGRGDQLGVVWYGHPNSWAAQEARNVWLGFAVKPPCEPVEFANDLATATVVVTDSGGVQEECNALGVPCVVARTVTDRPESLGPKGGAILGGNTRESIAAAIQEALKLDRSHIDPAIFGDGKASERLVDWWQEILSQLHKE